MAKERYYRHVTSCVLQRYCELEDGVVGSTFDPRALNYRIDVQRMLEKLPAAHLEVLMAIHRDGLTHADALRLAGLAEERPDRFVAKLETTVGQQFERAGMMDIEAYLQ